MRRIPAGCQDIGDSRLRDQAESSQSSATNIALLPIRVPPAQMATRQARWLQRPSAPGSLATMDFAARGKGMAIRVFIVDDHALVRTGMRMILSAEADIEVVGDAESGEAALPLIRKLTPDVVLCDLHLPGVSGLEVTERIVKGAYGTRVIVVSVLEDGPLPKRLLEAGASGYVGKGGDASELLRAVREVARGKRYLSSAIAQNLALSGIDGGETPFDILSSRETEVALLLVQGLRQEDIAKRLCLSAKTVNTHKTRLFEKLGISDSIALARLVGQYGLADPALAI